MRSLRGIAVLCIALGMPFSASRAAASIIAPVQVSQPIFAAEAGVVITTVTIMGHWQVMTQQDLEVRLTMAPSLVMDTTDSSRCANANAAAHFGLRLELPDVDWEKSSPETLRVKLIVPPLDEPSPTTRGVRSEWDFYADEVVLHTVQCIVINARRRWPQIRAVRLELPGAPRWKKLEGVHGLEHVVVPIRHLQLHDRLEK